MKKSLLKISLAVTLSSLLIACGGGGGGGSNSGNPSQPIQPAPKPEQPQPPSQPQPPADPTPPPKPMPLPPAEPKANWKTDCTASYTAACNENGNKNAVKVYDITTTEDRTNSGKRYYYRNS
ncbi:hypothetical protein ACFSAV_05980 [Pasteurella oralis]|uniref:Lipoprotein n=1 Tax=Pasteurella oralis TaxID=1071947 RepID=A0ABW4NVG2_9PAST